MIDPDVYSVEIYSPENQTSAILPIEVDRHTADRIAECYRVTTHLEAGIVTRTRWTDAE